MKMTFPTMARNVTIVTCAPELKGGLHAVGGLAELGIKVRHRRAPWLMRDTR